MISKRDSRPVRWRSRVRSSCRCGRPPQQVEDRGGDFEQIQFIVGQGITDHPAGGCDQFLKGCGMNRPFFVLGIVGGAALISAAVRAAEEGPKRPALPYTVSKETTYLTEPLRPDGSVDYAEAINQRLGKGVTSENNASVLIWRAAGPGEIPAAIRARYFARLGIDPPPEEGDYLIELSAFADRRRPPMSEEERERLFKEYDVALLRPWSRDECPLVAEWLAANERPLMLIVEASQRPRRFDPLIGGSEDDSELIAALLPAMSVYRTSARLLCARAMLKAKENNITGAWDDLLACYRLSRLIGQGDTLIDSLAAISIDSMAFSAIIALTANAPVSGEQLGKMRRDIAALTPQRRMAEIIDQGERLVFLDCVAALARQGLARLGSLFGEDGSNWDFRSILSNMLGKTAVDWDHLMRTGNRWYDRIGDALKKPSLALRRAALIQLRDEITELRKSAVDPGRLLADGFFRPRQAVSERLAEVLIALLTPAVDACVFAEDRWIVQHDVLATGLAAAAFAREHGRLPGSLDQLVPQYLPKVPEDILSDPPGVSIRYKTTDEGCVIYSVGRNRRDDQGRTGDDAAKAAEPGGESEGEHPDWDDITFRLKAPAGQRR